MATTGVTDPTPRTPVVPADSAPPAREPVAQPEVVETTQTTITGCLVADDDTFRLKNTSGTDAPKSRSWKSGFLRKRSATITLVDAGLSLHLAEHVGERVAVTGALTDRELRPRSVRRIAASCD
jgi:hypothetical protein